jgi:hypothetical protein
MSEAELIIFNHWEKPFKRNFPKILDTMGKKLARRFPSLQDEDEMCNFPLCRDVFYLGAKQR